jgi:hypothetical protein
MPDRHQLFDLTVPLLEAFVRGTVTFLAMLVLLRLAAFAGNQVNPW